MSHDEDRTTPSTSRRFAPATLLYAFATPADPSPRARNVVIVRLILGALCVALLSSLATVVSLRAAGWLSIPSYRTPQIQSSEVNLPSDAVCAQRVSGSGTEVRRDNTAANHRTPTTVQLAQLNPWTGAIGLDAQSDALRKRVTGNFTGTTDQIFQWAACKWGIDPDIVRAEAEAESTWHQSVTGDLTSDASLCPPDAKWKGSQCYQSYGILQIKYQYYKGAWPMARDDTAFNVDFVYGWLRNCYEGWTDYLYDKTPTPGYPTYHAGDIWGCVGMWYSGSWYDSGAIAYIATVKKHYEKKDWLQPSFASE